MTLHEFATLVHQLRQAQAHYGNHQSQEALAECLRLGVLVDRAVQNILHPPEQGDLFGAQPPPSHYQERR